jgi:aryl-alcohol dehydrogenase-like predicted oxidoreductase
MGGTYGHFDESEIIGAVHRALELGINLYDTAEAYGFGKSETILGKALGDRRKDVIVVSKVGVGYQNIGKDRSRDSRPEQIMKSIETTLKALGTDYLDVYLLHWPDRDTPFDESMKAMDKLVQQGKTRFVGVSNFKAKEIAECMETRRVDVGQYGYHLFDRRMEPDVFSYCHEQDIAMMAYGPLAHGLLTGAFDESTRFEETDWRAKGGAFNMPLFTQENFPRNLKVVSDLKGIAERHGRKLYELAIAWVLSNPAVDIALVGARTAAEVEADLSAADFVITDDLKKEIDEVFQKHGVNTRPDAWVD